MSNSTNEEKLFSNFHGIMKLIQCVLQGVLLVTHIFTESSKMGLRQSLSNILMSFNIIIIGCNSLVIFLIFVYNKEVFLFFLEILVFLMDLCCAVLLWANVYNNINSNSFRKIHLVIYTLVWVLQTTLLAVSTLKFLKGFSPSVDRNPPQNVNCAHFNYEQSCGRFGYKYDSRSEDRTHELTSIDENASLYYFASNSVDIIDLDKIKNENEADLNSMKNINKSILESDFEGSRKENEIYSIVENSTELNDKSIAVCNRENLLPLKSNRNIEETATLASCYEPTNSNQPAGHLSPKACSRSASESKLSTRLKMYKVQFTDTLEESNLQSDSNNSVIEKQDYEFQTLINPLKKEYVRTKTFSKSQSCAAKINSNTLIPNEQIKESDIVIFSDDSFGIDKSMESESNTSSKCLGIKSSRNTSENSNISTILIQGHRFQKETINRLKESLKPMSRFRAIEKMKLFF